jgi:hypothetical protein
MAHEERFLSELISSVVEYCPMLSKDKLESELYVFYKNDTFANIKSIWKAPSQKCTNYWK